MKTFLSTFATLLLFTTLTAAQRISNDVVLDRIRTAGAENSISVTYDETGKTTKLMAVSENFAKADANRAGILAMNFAVGVIYPGDALAKEPETFILTFWVLTNKPRFGENHAMTATLSEEMLVIGNARYVAKPTQQMEYLNFEVSREHLTKLTPENPVKFFLGDQEFKFGKSQIKLLSDVLAVTAVK